MEGHGSWRSTQSLCTPGVHYQRGATLCICDEDGAWPNPVCRDLFRVLHPVEVTGQTNLTEDYSCEPLKLYLVGCNVCFCPSTAVLDPAFCTNKECSEDDPVLEVKEGPPVVMAPKIENVTDVEVYATCNSSLNYELGCRNCHCLTNNRLLCSRCSDKQLPYTEVLNKMSVRKIKNKKNKKKKNNKVKLKSRCDTKGVNSFFFLDCNVCHCDEHSNEYCTTRTCIEDKQLKALFTVTTNHKFKEVKKPVDIINCIPGTFFKRDCNTCSCYHSKKGRKLINCSVKKCPNLSPIDVQKLDCVVGSFYEMDCMICSCVVKNKVKHQVCEIYPHCVKGSGSKFEHLKGAELKPVDSLHGYCEPMHKYKKGCNTCHCLSDGKTLMCSSKICVKRSSDSISIDLIPVHMNTNEACPRGHSYKLDCNICFCLSNGNSICTTAQCNE